MIIHHREFPNEKKYSMTLAGRPLTLEVGKLAELCNASVLVRYGDTTVLVAAAASSRPREGIDYFPMSIDFEEKLYAVGRIPGGFLRREGRPSERAVLAGRMIDRPMRPLFPSDLRNDVVITCTILSVDHDNSPEIAAHDRRRGGRIHLRHSLQRAHRRRQPRLQGRAVSDQSHERTARHLRHVLHDCRHGGKNRHD